MYGKHFSSMYDGSMVGSGAMAFALMGYVIANMRPDKEVGAQVRLNPDLLGRIFGESEADIQKAIDYLCAPDAKSTTPDEEGRRIIRVGQFDYRVVNGVKYMAIKNEEERREKNRLRQAELRERRRHEKDGKKKKANPMRKGGSGGEEPGFRSHQKAKENGATDAQLDSIVSESLPQKAR